MKRVCLIWLAALLSISLEIAQSRSTYEYDHKEDVLPEDIYQQRNHEVDDIEGLF